MKWPTLHADDSTLLVGDRDRWKLFDRATGELLREGTGLAIRGATGLAIRGATGLAVVKGSRIDVDGDRWGMVDGEPVCGCWSGNEVVVVTSTGIFRASSDREPGLVRTLASEERVV